jgi:hypothetical protein
VWTPSHSDPAEPRSREEWLARLEEAVGDGPFDSSACALIEASLGLGRIVAFLLPLSHFIPDPLTFSVPLFLKRRCDWTLGQSARVGLDECGGAGGGAAAGGAGDQRAGGSVRRRILALLRGDQGKRDAKLAQKLGQLQPFIAVFSQECIGQLASFGPT